jgi:tetratricopeptide (TPR) repeat protein
MPVAVTKAYERAAGGLGREGAADLQAILVDYPQGTYMHFHMGRLRELSGDLDGAEIEYRATLSAANVLGFDPVVTAARYALAQMLAKKGDIAAAKEQFDAMLKQWEHADTEFGWLKKVREQRRALEAK